MTESMCFDERVAIVTGAAGGLGRSYALDLARRGAHVVVNDLGSTSKELPSAAALAVVKEISAAGGTAIADGADVTDRAQADAMVGRAVSVFGRVDILINNAGILRDRSFAKLGTDDFQAVLDVHLMGAVHCTQAIWARMIEQRYGRVVMTTSSAGLYGNFGQANYGAAKAAVVGLMNVLALEGERHGIRVNAMSPAASTPMTEAVLSAEVKRAMGADLVAPAVTYLSSEHAPNGTILAAGGGSFARTYVVSTEGVHLEPEAVSAEAVAGAFEAIVDRTSLHAFSSASEEVARFASRAARQSVSSPSPVRALEGRS
jgi:NAD(P)-dependent dehydrogenase (short-subunit alcohol dehydrogenase family)